MANLRISSRCSAAVLGACGLTFALAFALALALPFACAFSPLPFMIPTNSAKEGPDPVTEGGDALPFVKESCPPPVEPSWGPASNPETTPDVVRTLAWDVVDTDIRSLSVYLPPTLAHHRVDSGSLGASGSAIPGFLIRFSIFCLGMYWYEGNPWNTPILEERQEHTSYAQSIYFKNDV